MKLAYLILAHGNPGHLQRLVRALTSAPCDVFIHVDRKSSLRDFEFLAAARVHLVEERVAVHWGDFSQVEAMLAVTRAALAFDPEFDRLVLLSGADFPLRSAAEIERHFRAHPQAEFINLVAMPSAAARKPIERLTKVIPRKTGSPLLRKARRLLQGLHLSASTRDYKPAFGELRPYAGSTWWALTGSACSQVLHFAQTHPALVEFFKNTDCPDESFFQTALGNSRFLPFVERNLTYADWSQGGARPADLRDDRLPFLLSRPSFGEDDVYGPGPMLFARKFDDSSAALVDRLASHLALAGE